MRFIGAALIVALALSASFMVQANDTTGVRLQAATDVKGLKVTLDVAGFATKTKSSIVRTLLNHPDEPPFMNGEPQHLRIKFDDDKLLDTLDHMIESLNVE